ncbi:MAG: universal stress protein [Steroidobacteraceae bacterium]
MRVILVPVADRPECVFALEAAFQLATRHEANVVGCHVRPHRADNARLNSVAARALFGGSAKEAGFRISKRSGAGGTSLAIWHEMLGTPDRILAICGPVADLAVLSRPKPKGAGTAREFLLATLFNSARPLLVLPQRRIGRLGTRILIAWNQRPEAALAVTAALPLLQKAAQITIVICGPEDRPGPKTTHLRDYLAHWGVRAEHVRTRGRDVDGEIAHSYQEMNADLLVMGAYSRHRMRERIFGGVTETMLFRSNLPVLMYHP